MNFTPKTEAEIEAEGLLPEGVYDYTVFSAQDKTSNNGNEMIVLELVVFDAQGKPRKLRDWIMPSFPRKLRHFCEHAGMLDIYNSGKVLAVDCVNRSGRVQIIIEPASEKYRISNKVEDYVSGTMSSKPASDDDMPF